VPRPGRTTSWYDDSPRSGIFAFKQSGPRADENGMDARVDLDALSLVPPARLGRALAEARTARRMTLPVAATATGGRFSAAELAAVEAGEHPVSDRDAAMLARLYGVPAGRLVPVRARLVLDLHARTMAVGTERVGLSRRVSLTEAVLTRYLAIVHQLRGIPPGAPIRYRRLDLEVLAEALYLPPAQIEARLDAITVANRSGLDRWGRLFSRRLVVPSAGILVASTRSGSLVLESGDPTGTGTHRADEPGTKDAQEGSS